MDWSGYHRLRLQELVQELSNEIQQLESAITLDDSYQMRAHFFGYDLYNQSLGRRSPLRKQQVK